MTDLRDAAAARGADVPPAGSRSLARRLLVPAWLLVAGLGLAFGIATLQLHVGSDPLADVHAYYDAATRLNAGQPLYPAGRDIDTTQAYFYPPLLAMAFRPFAALLPFEPVALLWEALCIGSFVLTLYRLGLRRPEVWIATCVLAMPIAWSLAIGQAQVPVTLLLTIGSPWAVALAANLKVMPALVAVFWLGRRDLRSLGKFLAFGGGLLLLQLVLDPANTIAFFQTTNLQLVGEVHNFSPYAISPALWVVFVVVLGLAALRLAPSRFGWAAAVTFSVLFPPRLLSYMLMSLLAAFRVTDGRAGASGAAKEASPPGAVGA